jgi:transposase
MIYVTENKLKKTVSTKKVLEELLKQWYHDKEMRGWIETTLDMLYDVAYVKHTTKDNYFNYITLYNREKEIVFKVII